MADKKVLLSYGYGLKNAGDMAITLGAINLLQKKYRVTVLSRFDREHPEYEKSKKFILKKFPDVKIVPSPFRLNRSAGLTTKIKDHVDGAMQITGLTKNHDLGKLIDEMDLVVFNGGNLFRCESFSDFARLSALMYPLKEAQKRNIPYVIFPQSASNINRFGRILLNKPLKNAQEVWCREEISKDYLQRMFQLDEVNSTLDLAFYLNHQENNIRNGNTGKKKIAVTVRSYTVGDLDNFPEEKQNKIVDVITDTVRFLPQSYQVELVIQTEKDRLITHRVLETIQQFRNDVLIYEEYDPVKLIGYYKDCNVLLGMRLHSIILALNSGTPCIGFFDKEWGFKNPGLMEQFNLPFKYLDSNFTDGFVSEINKLLENEENMRRCILNVTDKEKNSFYVAYE